MGIFSTSKQEYDDLRGVPEHRLPSLTDNHLILLAIGILMETMADDPALTNELYKRAGSNYRMDE